MPTDAGVPAAELGVVLERPYSRYSKQRLLKDGEELPRDRWNTYVLPGEDGRNRIVQVVFDVGQLGLAVEVDGRRYLAVAPLPGWVRVLLVAMVLVGTLLGAVGAGLVMGAVIGTLSLLRRPDRRRLHLVLACLLPPAALATSLAVALAVRQLT